MILVSKPATISMMSATGMLLISNCRCWVPCWDWEGRRTSSRARLWIWDKLLTRMRLGELASEPPSDAIDRNVGCRRGESGDACEWGRAELIASGVAWLPK